jgi:hypothetical protein
MVLHREDVLGVQSAFYSYLVNVGDSGIEIGMDWVSVDMASAKVGETLIRNGSTKRRR